MDSIAQRTKSTVNNFTVLKAGTNEIREDSLPVNRIA